MIIDGKRVQVKIIQKDSVDIKEKPDYLIVLKLDIDKFVFYEVYAGDASTAWDVKGKEYNGEYTIFLSKLKKVRDKISEKIQCKNYIEVY